MHRKKQNRPAGDRAAQEFSRQSERLVHNRNRHSLQLKSDRSDFARACAIALGPKLAQQSWQRQAIAGGAR